MQLPSTKLCRKSVRWSNKKYVQIFEEYAKHLVSSETGFRVFGVYYDDENILDFDVTAAVSTGKNGNVDN